MSIEQNTLSDLFRNPYTAHKLKTNNLTKNQTFHYVHCNTPKRVTS